MDPLSIASGIAGLLVLAMQIVDGSSEFVSSYRALPDEARKLWDDFQGLYLVIKRLEALRKELQGGNVLQPFLEAVEEGDLPSILASLETSLCRIQRLTKSYGKMASSMKLKIQWLVIGRYEAVKIRRMTANDKDTLVVLLSIVQTRTLNLMFVSTISCISRLWRPGLT